MALFRKLFYRKPPDGLLEISERVYVFDYCFTTDAWEEQNYKGYVGGIIAELREHYPDASILLFNFREGNTQSMIANALSEYDMTIMDYPRHYEGCPLLPMEVIHHFLRSGESWLSLGVQNVLLMHCERGGWPVLAFMLAALLIYRKQYSGESKTLEMVYKQAPRELVHLLSPLNPMPSQLRYLQYISRRNVASEWPPLDRALTIECVIIRMIPNFDGAGGCRPIFRIYGQDPFLVSDRAPKVLFSTPKKSRTIRYYKQAECELVKIDINCHIQGDVVLECISLHDDMEREEMMFRAMFNTAFIRSNILMLNRDEIDLLWDAKDRFPKDFRAEVLFSEMDAAASIVPQDFPLFEEKDGLPVEAFARVQEIFSSVDWVVPKNDSAVEVDCNNVCEAYSDGEKLHKIQTAAALEYIKSSMDSSPQSKRSSPQSISTTPTRTKKNTEFDPGQPVETSLSPVTPSLQDKVGIHHGSPLLQQAEILSASTLTLKNDIAVRHSISIHSAQSPVNSDIAFKEGHSKSAFISAVSSSTEGVAEDAGIAPSSIQVPASSDVITGKEPSKPALAPSAPLSTEGVVIDAGVVQSSVSSKDVFGDPLKPSVPPSAPLSTEGIVKGAQTSFSSDIVSGKGLSKSVLPPSAQSSTGGVVKGSIAPPPPPPPPPSKHYCSTVDIENSTKDIHLPDIENVLSDCDDAQPSEVRLHKTPHPPHVSSSTADDTYKTPICPSTTSLEENSADKNETSFPLLCTTLLPGGQASGTIPSPPPPPPPCVSLNENSSARRGSPPPPPPLPPPTPPHMSRFKDHSAFGVSPPPPPPFPPASLDIKVTRPPPPPPPPLPATVPSPRENSSIRLVPPPPPPPLHSRHDDGVINTSQVLPPPPPPAPAGAPRPSTSAPPVPSAPPPPLPSHNLSSPRDRFVSPSPPPPSAPPPGAKGKALLSRAVNSRNNPNKKLKPLHWLKITRAVSGSLWAEAQKTGEASKAPEIDISELESLFSTATSDQGVSGRKVGSRASMVHKPEKVQLIDHRRAYNCEIMLSKVKIPLHELLTSVLALEDTALDIDQVDNVIKFCPTKEEMELLKGYKGEKDKLGKCEQFFLELMQVPRVESKLRVFSFKIQFSSQVSDLKNSLNVVNSAADQIRGSAKLKRIMQTILSLGNALNQGTARGSAVGFRLDSLLKLTETRAMNNKMTLMHYLCKVLADKLPELLDFWEDLCSLDRASKIQLKYLAEEMQAINKGLEKIVQELSMSENDGPVSDQFRKALKEFLRFSESEVRSLASLYSGVGRNVDALILYFGEDPARCPFEQVISTLLNFVRMFKKAHEENCKQLELDKKKAEKEASAEKLKIKSSDAGNMLQSSVRSVK